jgi:small conductance mechanosensitive channel
MTKPGEQPNQEIQKRAKTLLAVMRRPLLFVIWTVVLLGILAELGLHVQPLLAGAGIGAGIVGVAVGFGGQTLIKDMIAGLFLLIENQIRLGDVAMINGTGGLVEEINLRTTVLRSENGAVHVFPNGSIQTLANLTREFAHAVVEISIGFEDDPDRAISLLKEIGVEVQADPGLGPFILAPLEVMGVDRIVNSGIVIKARLKILAMRQWMVGREFNRRMLKRFTEEGISLAPPANVVKLEASSPEELKNVIRAVLAEVRARPDADTVA